MFPRGPWSDCRASNRTCRSRAVCLGVVGHLLLKAHPPASACNWRKNYSNSRFCTRPEAGLRYHGPRTMRMRRRDAVTTALSATDSHPSDPDQRSNNTSYKDDGTLTPLCHVSIPPPDYLTPRQTTSSAEWVCRL